METTTTTINLRLKIWEATMETTIMETTLEMETMAVSTKAIKVLETGMGLEALQVTISMKLHRMIKELRIVISTAQMAVHLWPDLRGCWSWSDPSMIGGGFNLRTPLPCLPLRQQSFDLSNPGATSVQKLLRYNLTHVQDPLLHPISYLVPLHLHQDHHVTRELGHFKQPTKDQRKEEGNGWRAQAGGGG